MTTRPKVTKPETETLYLQDRDETEMFNLQDRDDRDVQKTSRDRDVQDRDYIPGSSYI